VTRTRVSLVTLIICAGAFVNSLNADDSIMKFSQQTLNGKTIKSETLKGMPMVINIGSHW
jgi:hypothetical protein